MDNNNNVVQRPMVITCLFDNSQLGPDFKHAKKNTGQYLWPINSTLHVFFADNYPQTNSRVLSIASEWTPFSTIRFIETTNPEQSHIRITYHGKASTVLGILANQKSKDENTMYLDSLHTNQNENVFRRIVLHEFGHALGLVHEHEDPSNKIPWVPISKASNFFKTTYGWSVSQTILNVTQPPVTTNICFDRYSIMRYPVPSPELLAGSWIDLQPASSVLDMKFADLRDVSTNTGAYNDFVDSLDSDTKFWRKVGSGLGFSVRDLDRFAKYPSPTKKMLSDWVQSDPTVGSLVDVLVKAEYMTSRDYLMSYATSGAFGKQSGEILVPCGLSGKDKLLFSALYNNNTS